MKFGTATIQDNGDGILLRTPYDDEFKEALKERVPWRERSWDSDEKAWQISDKLSSAAIRVAAEFFNVEYEDGYGEDRERSTA